MAISVNRAMLLIALLVLSPLAGCIELPEESAETTSTTDAQRPPAPDARISGMTAEEAFEDKVGPCEGNGIQIPPRAYCGTRVYTIDGQIGEERIPVELLSMNGRINIQGTPGDAWSLLATIKSSGLTEEGAREALDGGWEWSHEKDGKHGIWASPNRVPMLSDGRVEGTTYELSLPTWVTLDLTATTTNGRIEAKNLRTALTTLTTSNGAIEFTGTTENLEATTSNGGIDADITTIGASEGAIRAKTSNGAIELILRETRERGYDLDAQTTNGKVNIDLTDGRLTTDEKNHKHFTTNDYDRRDIRRTIDLTTTNGRINVNS